MVFRRDNNASPRTRCRQSVLNHVERISAAAPRPQGRALANSPYRDRVAQKQAGLPAQDWIVRGQPFKQSNRLHALRRNTRAPNANPAQISQRNRKI
jgi:hypothetical protein